MKNDELRRLLENNNTLEAPDWDRIKETYQPVPVEYIANEPVYEFNMIFDPKVNPIEDSIFISQRSPAAYVPLHIHHYLELTYVYQGKATVMLRDLEVELQEGDIILIDKNTPHTIKETRATDIIIEMKLKHDYLSTGFLSRFKNKSIISQFLVDSLLDTRRANHYLYFPYDSHSNIVEIMAKIMCDYYDQDMFTLEVIDAYLFILFTELIRYSNQHSEVHPSQQKETIVLELLKYIEEHFKECSLTELGEKFGYHPNYISAVLKKATGKSFTDLLQIERLNKAAFYLSNTNLAIPEIAAEVGYSSVSFFYKKFNEIFSQTPKEYREQVG